MGYSTPLIHAQTAFLCCMELSGRISDTICVCKLICFCKKQVSERARLNTEYMLGFEEFMGKQDG